MSDVRTLLHDTAATPSRGPDLRGAQRSARTRRRRQRGFAVVAMAVVAAAAGAGLVRAADDGGSPAARIAIGPRQSTDAPDGWTRVVLDSGISFAMPPTWDTFDFGTTPVAQRRVAVGSVQPASDGVMMACTPDGGQLPTEAGSWVTLHEYVGNPTSGEFTLPGGDRSGFESIPDRPDDFRTIQPFASCPVEGTGLTASFEEIPFREAGRVFVARIVTAYPSGEPPDLTDGQEVLNTLRISPLPAATTTTGVAPTVPVPSDSMPPTTTAAPFVPTSDDERQITDLFVAWQRNHPDAETRAMVEDADALLDTIHQGIAQHSEADLAKYSGRVESVQVTDPDHAVVVYTLLFDGVPQFGRRSGNAVKIDGVWKVSRETECALLALGGLTCPPRSNA